MLTFFEQEQFVTCRILDKKLWLGHYNNNIII